MYVTRYPYLCQTSSERGFFFLQSIVDLELFREIHRVEEALRQYRCSEALAWCNENKNSLKKIKASFAYYLTVFELIVANL